MSIFMQDLKTRRPQKTPTREIVAARILTFTLVILIVLIVIALPNALDVWCEK